jgi:hypothetical protein
MATFPMLILFVLLVSFIIIGIIKSDSGLKLMILGVNITLLGGIIVLDPDVNLNGFEYLMAFFGLFICLIGLWKKD